MKRRELWDAEDHVSVDGAQAGSRVLEPGAVLLVVRGMILAHSVPVAITRSRAAFNQDIKALVCKEGLSPEYMLSVLEQDKRALLELVSPSTHGTMRLSTEELMEFPVYIPAPPEQDGIVKVLQAIEQAIQNTEAVIEATETLRKALLQELLTRGVPGWHTEWKTVPGIGIIPACWGVVKLGEVAEPFQYGTSAKCDARIQGTPVLRIPNVAQGQIDLRDLKYAQLSAREVDSLRLATGDLLFVRTNGNPEICGRVAHVSQLEGDWAFASYLVRLRTRTALEPLFLWHYLGQENGRKSLSRHIRTSAGNFNLSVSGTRGMEIPLPPATEQRAVCSVTAAADSKIEHERQLLTHLRAIKRETASALLSGQVRVPRVGVANE